MESTILSEWGHPVRTEMTGSSEAYVPGMVSIVIPTFNRAEFLRECIDSALAQYYPQFEVIVVDDGSTDDTPQLCRQYGDRIRYFRKPNGGATSAKNFGIQKMRGEWLKFLDSDDVLERNALSTFIEWARRLRADMLYCDYVNIDSRGRLIKTRQPVHLDEDELLRALWSGRNAKRHLEFNSGLSGAGFIHRPLLLKLGMFDGNLAAGEDWEWALRAALIHKCYGTCVPFPLYRVRRHPGQLTNSTWEVRHERERRVHDIIKRRLANTTEAGKSLVEHYRQEAQRLWRIYLPLIMLGRLLRKAPLQGKARFLAWAIAPSLLDRIYWAANPPVDVRRH